MTQLKKTVETITEILMNLMGIMEIVLVLMAAIMVSVGLL